MLLELLEGFLELDELSDLEDVSVGQKEDLEEEEDSDSTGEIVPETVISSEDAAEEETGLELETGA